MFSKEGKGDRKKDGGTGKLSSRVSSRARKIVSMRGQ